MVGINWQALNTDFVVSHLRQCALRLAGFVLLSLTGVVLFILIAMFVFVMHCITVSVPVTPTALIFDARQRRVLCQINQKKIRSKSKIY